MLINTPQTLSVALRELRKEKGITQVSLAESTGLRQSTVSQTERSCDKVYFETILKMLNSLDWEIHLLPKHTANNHTQGDDEEW